MSKEGHDWCYRSFYKMYECSKCEFSVARATLIEAIGVDELYHECLDRIVGACPGTSTRPSLKLVEE